MSPASTSSVIKCVVTPPSFLRLIKYHIYCATPLYSGSKEPWQFMHPYFGILINSFFRRGLLYTKMASGLRDLRKCRNCGEFRSFTLLQGIPYFLEISEISMHC